MTLKQTNGRTLLVSSCPLVALGTDMHIIDQKPANVLVWLSSYSLTENPCGLGQPQKWTSEKEGWTGYTVCHSERLEGSRETALREQD